VTVLDANVKKQLKIKACKVRMGILEAVFNANSGHPGGSLSIADIMTYLYFHRLNVDPQNPQWEDRDRLVLSKGHVAPALYSVLAQKGFFSPDLLKTLRKSDSILQGHPSMKMTPGVDMSTGSLGQGLSVAVGMALGAKIDGKAFRTYAVLGDGEIQEGQIWEAAMFASAKGLDNLVAVVDNNNLQIDGSVAEVNSPNRYPKCSRPSGGTPSNIAPIILTKSMPRLTTRRNQRQTPAIHRQKRKR
jgi:transketolase